ncbi:MAG: MBL fold metallo-hydrolase [Brachymonas sp.]
MDAPFRFRSLGSGSSGNATLIELGGQRPQRLLVDAGFSSVKKLEQRLHSASGLMPDAVDAIFITHEHSDHVGCALKLAEKYDLRLFMSRGTHRAIGSPDLGGRLHCPRDGDSVELGHLAFEPFTVPHDALEPLQLRCTDGSAYLGILTDLGHGSAHVLEMLQPCQTVLLEFNHDPELLDASAYPPFLKKRVAGPLGHLPNHEALRISRQLITQGQLRCIVAAHLSERNNRPEIVAQLLHSCAQDHPELAHESCHIACPNTGTDWIDCYSHAFA